MKVTMEGRARLAAKLKKASADVQTNVNRAVAEVGEDLLTVVMPGVPMSAGPDAGDLRRSGYVDHSKPGIADVGFSAPHAVFVHEMGEEGGVYPERAPINWTTPGTGAKYLTGPFLLNRARYKDYIMDAARKGLE